MEMNRHTRLLAAWIACFAILLVSLAPSVSHALTAAGTPGSAWTEICSSVGIKLVKVSPDQAAGSASEQQSDVHVEHCPFCSSHAGAIDLPPSYGFVAFVASTKAIFPSLFYQSPRPLFIWASAQSRAPPSLS